MPALSLTIAGVGGWMVWQRLPEPWNFYGAAGCALLGGLGCALRYRPPAQKGSLMWEFCGERWTVEEGCQNWLVTGGIGSGKTNALNFLVHNLNQHQPDWGGLWLDNKGNSERELRGIMAAAGREEDVTVLRTGEGGKRYNVLADPAFTFETLGFAIAEIASGGDKSQHGKFFREQAALHSAQAMHALRVLEEPVTLQSIYPVLTDAAATAAMVQKLLQSKHPEAPALHSHFQNKFLAMPGDQFGGVTGTLLNVLRPFQTPEVATVFAGEAPNDFAFQDLDDGKILCLSLPQRFPQERYALNALLKHLFYQFALLRYDRENVAAANVLCLWLDEAQHSLRSGAWGDYRFLDRLRAARCAVVIAMQDHTSCYPTLGKDTAIVTLAQLRNRLIFSAPTFESAEISANFIGKREIQKVTRGFNGGKSSISRTPHEEHILKAQDITGLPNHRCHLYHANKRLRRKLCLPVCDPLRGAMPPVPARPSAERSVKEAEELRISGTAL
ncbi:MAG: type IV secretion system DNA-binding domain-containing protein [Verrucomicrobiota bacterium]